MKVAIVTGFCGQIGSETCIGLHAEGYAIVGIDNDMRSYFFGAGAPTSASRSQFETTLPRHMHAALNI